MSVQEVLYFSVWFSSGKLGIYVSFQNGPSIFLTYLRWEKEAYCSSPISKQFLNILFSKTAEYVPIPKAQFHSKQAALGGWHCYTDQMLSWLGSCEDTNNSWVTREAVVRSRHWPEQQLMLVLLRELFGKQIAFAESCLDNSDLADKLFLKAAVISYLMQALCWAQGCGKNSFPFGIWKYSQLLNEVSFLL